jgi:hypothetical protein
MSEATKSFPDLARDFAAAVDGAKTSAAALPFVSLQFTALLNHKAETDDDKRHLTGLMAGLAVTWFTGCSSAKCNGEFRNAPELLQPMMDALQAPQALPFIPPDTVQKFADACIALAQNGPALLAKAGPDDDSASSIELRKENREALLDLAQRTLDFANKCKEFRDGLTFDPKTTKDIAPVKRIELKAGAQSNG